MTNCFGHIIESQPPENYNPEYKEWKIETLAASLSRKIPNDESAAKQVKTIIELIRRADVTEIIHAGDQMTKDSYLSMRSWNMQATQNPLSAF